MVKYIYNTNTSFTVFQIQTRISPHPFLLRISCPVCTTVRALRARRVDCGDVVVLALRATFTQLSMLHTITQCQKCTELTQIALWGPAPSPGQLPILSKWPDQIPCPCHYFQPQLCSMYTSTNRYPLVAAKRLHEGHRFPL